jgi:hypothetical protein
MVVDGSQVKFSRTNNSRLIFEDCDINTTCVGSFLDSSDVEFINSKVINSNYYTVSNAVNYGTIMNGVTASSIKVNGSYIEGSIAFNGTGTDCEIVGSTVLGECNYGASNKMVIQSSTIGSSSSAYHTTNENRLRGDKMLVISDVVNTISDLVIYSGSAYFSNQRITGLTIDGLTSNRSPNLKFMTSYADTSVISLIVDGASFRNGSSATASLRDTVEFGTSGSGTWTATQDVRVINTVATNIGDAYYIKRETSGTFFERKTETFTSGAYVYTKNIYPLVIGSIDSFRYTASSSYGKRASALENSYLICNSKSVDNGAGDYGIVVALKSYDFPTTTRSYTFDVSVTWSVFGG